MAGSSPRPPFRVGPFIAVAYVAGRYMPGSSKAGQPGFFGLYLSRAKEMPRFSLQSFDPRGRNLSYSRVAEKGESLEFALILAWLRDEVPFDQWRPFPIGPKERSAIRALGLHREHELARRSLGAVLYQSRILTYVNIRHAQPLFRLRPRSPAAIRRDQAEYHEIIQSLGLTRRPARKAKRARP